MLHIAIVTGTRPGRLNEAVARWIVELARRRADVQVSLVDIAAYALAPMVDGPGGLGRQAPEHVSAWSRTVSLFDSFVFVTPEYNRASSSALKYAIDIGGRHWRNKSAGFVGYGAGGATGAVDDLREALAGAGVATVAPQVALTLVREVSSESSFVPDRRHAPEVHGLLEQVITWGRALKAVRVATSQEREATPSLLAWSAAEGAGLPAR